MDELFIGWEKILVPISLTLLLLNYKINKTVKIEAGMDQIVQQGKRINDKAVFQYISNRMVQYPNHISKFRMKK